jgi:hypothetical protein
MAMPARVDIFGEALDLMPVALHYSGHGYNIHLQYFLSFKIIFGKSSTILSAF